MTPLRVDGTRLVSDGQAVVLRGFGLGGWMNMENFITGYAGSESQMRRALTRVLGPATAAAYFDRLLEVFFTDADAAFLSSLGVNSLRIPFNYRHFEDDDRPGEVKDDGFALLDGVVEACARHGIFTILDLHALPGGQNQHWHSDNPTQWAHFWSQRQFQDRVVTLWERIADRYRGHAWVAGYNPVNEPADAHGTQRRRLERGAREISGECVAVRLHDGETHAVDGDAIAIPQVAHERRGHLQTAALVAAFEALDSPCCFNQSCEHRTQ